MRSNGRFNRAFTLALALFALPLSAFAESPSDSAREHFTRGYAFAQSGDANAAIREFEQAYAASPNTSVLYNLGQAYAAAGRSSEALDALQRYLELGGAAVTEARAQQVNALIAYHAQRVGQLEIELEPRSATLLVDGAVIGSGPRTIRLNAGPHGLTATAPGFESRTVRANVTAQTAEKLSIRLAPQAEPAHLSIACALDDVRVFVDGVPRGQTPLLAGIATTSGSHRVRFERIGYLPDERAFTLAAGASQVAACQLGVDTADPSHGTVSVWHPAGTRVTLDGLPFRGSIVAHGVHRLQVVGAGYAPETTRIELLPRQRMTLTLLPAREPLAQRAERERSRTAVRVWSYVMAGVAVATGATAAAIYVDDNSRYAAWQAKSRTTVKSLPSDPNAPQTLDALLAEENGIRKRDAVALGLSVLSCSALAASAVLFFSSRAPSDQLVLSAGAAPSLRYVHTF
jgi:hypothetical protein